MAASQSESALPLPANGVQPPARPAGAAGRSAAASRAQGRESGRILHLPPGPPGPSDALWSGPTPLHAAPPPLPSGPQQLPRRRRRRHPGGGRRDLKAAAAAKAAEASALPVPRAPPSDGERLAAGPRRGGLSPLCATASHSAAQRPEEARQLDCLIGSIIQKGEGRELMKSPKRNQQAFTPPYSQHISTGYSK